jgi:hypothetical protein
MIDQGDSGGCVSETDCDDVLSKDEMIQATIRIYHIAIPRGASVVYNPDLSNQEFQPRGQVDGRTMSIGDSAFSSWDFLASTIYHESIHVIQRDEGRSYPGNYLEHNGPTMNELEAYTKEKAWVKNNELVLSSQALSDIDGNIKQAGDFLKLHSEDSYARTQWEYPIYPIYLLTQLEYIIR